MLNMLFSLCYYAPGCEADEMFCRYSQSDSYSLMLAPGD